MDRTSIIGVVLISLILFLWYSYNRNTNSSLDTAESSGIENSNETQNSPSSSALEILPEAGPKVTTAPESLGAETAVEASTPLSPPAIEAVREEQLIRLENSRFIAQVSTKGAELVSYKLKEHFNNDEMAEMVLPYEQEPYPFAVFIGDLVDGDPASNRAKHINAVFDYEELASGIRRFSHEFTLANGLTYRLEKDFIINASEYMFELHVRLISTDQSALDINENNILYSLYYGPQIGPDIGEIGSNRAAPDTRTFRYNTGKRVKRVKLSNKKPFSSIEQSLLWSAIVGKYFSVIGLPGRDIISDFSQNMDLGEGLQSSQLIFKRQANNITSNQIEDIYRFYIGPNLSQDLNIYNTNTKNDFNLSGMNMGKIVSSFFGLASIEKLLKLILRFLYGFINNYGISVIILAVFIRILLFPFTVKSYKSTSKMQEVQPKIKALQQKLKDKPQELQKEMGQLYKREGVNPLGGCLPLLLQMPIILAMANLFYKYFDFRGAAFIPGWIDDLSVPESVYSFAFNSSIPILGDSLTIRLLPVIYLASQLVLSKIMQLGNSNPNQSALQTKIFTTYMPIFFFFILYNMPSGLIMYWTVSNILIVGQQLLMNKYKHLIHAKPKAKSKAKNKSKTKNMLATELKKRISDANKKKK